MAESEASLPQPRFARLALRAVQAVFLTGCIALLWAIFTRPDHVREYRLYLMEDRPAAVFRFEQLSEEWTEADLRQFLRVITLRCYDNRPGEYLDTRSCFADIRSFNGVSAMTISFYFADGKLNRAMVMVPWWSPQRARSMLQAIYGRPAAVQTKAVQGVRLVGWKLADGAAVFYNRDPTFDPTDWNSIYWQSSRQCSQQSCFTPAQ